MKKIISLLIAFSMLLALFSGCTASTAKNAKKLSEKLDGMIEETKIEWTDPDTASITFDEHDVNTVLINAVKDDAVTVKIYNLADNKLIYEQESSGKVKYCSFDSLETTGLKLEMKDGEVLIDEVCVYENENEPDDDFRVTTYVIADNIQEASSLDSQSFDTITDVILFSCVEFNESGELEYVDSEDVSGKTKLKTALENLRTVIGDRKVNIYINVLGPDADDGIEDWNTQMENKAGKHTKAFKNESLASDISDLLKEYSLDGVFFDYEYPIKSKNWKPFSEFIVSLDAELGNKKIGLAMADWDIGLSKQAVGCIDMVEMMEYDLFDDNGDHSSLLTAQNGIEKFIAAGFDEEVLDLGIPFYGRPTDKSANWYNYNEYSSVLGKYGNKTEIAELGLDAYFNSYQLVYDKTALAIDYKLGGVMIWHYTCDDFENKELSLFKAIGECIKNRQA